MALSIIVSVSMFALLSWLLTRKLSSLSPRTQFEGFADAPENGMSSPDPLLVLRKVVDVIQAIPDRLHDASVDMASTIRDKLYEYGDIVNGESDEHNDDPSMTVIEHKDALDSLRRTQPTLYKVLVKAAEGGSVLTPSLSGVVRSMVKHK